MRIIFLDFDGVLNSQSFYETRTEEKKAEDYPFRDLDNRAVGNLNIICEETSAKVVVTSTWRSGRSPAELQKLLEPVGFKGEIIDKTPHLSNDYVLRGNEVLAWIKQNKPLLGKDYYDFHSYVIIDDDSDFLYWQKDNLLLTDVHNGLTHNTAYKAVRMFNKFVE
jgi:hypothetical protein